MIYFEASYESPVFSVPCFDLIVDFACRPHVQQQEVVEIKWHFIASNKQ